MRSSSRRAARLAFPFVVVSSVAIAGLGAAACTEDGPPPSQLVLAFQTDLKLPDDVSQVVLSIESRGNLLFAETYKVGPSGVKLPATLTVHDPEDGSKPVSIRLMALSPTNQPRVLRETVTTVPRERSALLRMPIQWLCYNEASIGNVDAVKAVATEPARVVTRAAQSACAPDAAGGVTTCGGGRCLPAVVDSASLPEFVPGKVFGGGDESGGGTCFDVASCFGVGTLVAPDEACTIPAPADPARFSVALRLPKTASGVCDDAQCWIALDGESDEGWRTRPDGRVELPPSVCARKLEVVATTACRTKTSDLPACGPWSSVGGAPETATGGVPFVADAGTEGGAVDDAGGDTGDLTPAVFASPAGTPLAAAVSPTHVTWATRSPDGRTVTVFACDKRAGCASPRTVFTRQEALPVEVPTLVVVDETAYLHTVANAGMNHGVYACPLDGACAAGGVQVRLTESAFFTLDVPPRSAARSDLLFAGPGGVSVCQGVQARADFCANPTFRMAAGELAEIEPRVPGEGAPYAIYSFENGYLEKCTKPSCALGDRVFLGSAEPSAVRVGSLVVGAEDPPVATWLADRDGSYDYRGCVIQAGADGGVGCVSETIGAGVQAATTHRIAPRAGQRRRVFGAFPDGAGARLVAHTYAPLGAEQALAPATIASPALWMFPDDDDPAAVYVVTSSGVVRAIAPRQP